jgi:hypothetical protein
MKRATTVTLLCLGAGAFFVANAFESHCDTVEETQQDKVDWGDGTTAPPKPRPSCRSYSGYSHSYYSGSSSSHSGYGFASAGVARGGFGGSGHASAS